MKFNPMPFEYTIQILILIIALLGIVLSYQSEHLNTPKLSQPIEKPIIK